MSVHIYITGEDGNSVMTLDNKITYDYFIDERGYPVNEDVVIAHNSTDLEVFLAVVKKHYVDLQLDVADDESDEWYLYERILSQVTTAIYQADGIRYSVINRDYPEQKYLLNCNM